MVDPAASVALNLPQIYVDVVVGACASSTSVFARLALRPPSASASEISGTGSGEELAARFRPTSRTGAASHDSLTSFGVHLKRTMIAVMLSQPVPSPCVSLARQ